LDARAGGLTVLAAVYERPGDPHEVLELRELPTPEPRPGEVRVRLRLAGVNPTDWKSRAARPATASRFQVPGQDGVGEIDMVGEGLPQSLIGTRVWVWFAAHEQPWGTAAQWTVVPAERAVALPDVASLELGASLGVPAMTAHYCLFADGPVADADVLVAGGAGAVGHFAIELGRWAGARVLSTASSEGKAVLARAAGAELVVDYRSPKAAEQLREAAPAGVQRVIEVSLDQNLELDLAVSAPRAVICTYADSGPKVPLAVRPLMTRNLVLRFVLLYNAPPEDLIRATREINAAIEQGALSELPVTRFPLERTADAHQAVERGAIGKVLIEIP
jgi:NADPH:quinone reductase